VDALVVQWVKIAMDRDLDEEEVLEVVHEEVRGEVLEVMIVLNAEDMADIKLLFVLFLWPHPLGGWLSVSHHVLYTVSMKPPWMEKQKK